MIGNMENNSYLSYSKVKLLLQGEGYYLLRNEYEEKETDSILKGILLEQLVQNKSLDVSVNYNNITQKEINIIRELSSYDRFNDEDILHVANKLDYYKNYKDETRINKISKLLDDNKHISDGKIVVSRKVYDSVMNMFDVLVRKSRKNSIIDMLLNADNYQSERIFKFKDVYFKSIIDAYKVIEDFGVRVAYILELKYLNGNIFDFKRSYFKFRYYIQSYLYREAIRHGWPSKDYINYKSFYFIVVYETNGLKENFYDVDVIVDTGIFDNRASEEIDRAIEVWDRLKDKTYHEYVSELYDSSEYIDIQRILL